MILKGLISNIAFLIVLSFLYSFLYRKQYKIDKLIYKFSAGVLFGLIAVAGMIVPLQFSPGIIFDGRSIILSIAGLFGGGIVAAISAIITGIYRYQMGGSGTTMGLGVIFTSGLIGVLYRYFFTKPGSRKLLYLYLFGIVVHISMIIWMLALPGSARMTVLRQLSGPVLLIYPLATVLVAKMLMDQENYISSQRILIESEAWLRKIIDHNPHFIFIRNEDGIYQIVNIAMAEAYGMTPLEMEGKSDADFISSEADIIRFKAQDLQIISGESDRLDIEDSFIDSQGKKRILHIIKVPFDLLQSGKKAVLGVCADITNLRRVEAELKQKNAALEKEIINCINTEKALQESERTFRSIVESSPMGIHIYRLEDDNRLIFEGANPAADKLVGVDHSQFIGKTIEEAFPPLADTEVPEKYRLAAKTGESWHTTQLDYQDDIINGAFEVSAFQMLPGKTAVLFNNVTDRKLAEAELQKYRDNLEEMIRERTKSLTEKTASYEDSQLALSYLMEDVNEARFELEKVNAQYAAVNKELETFSYSISHDLRAPLRAIDGFSKIIEEDYFDKLDDEAKECITIIRNNAQMMGMLINDLLEFSRLSRKDIKLHEIDMNNLVQDLLIEFKQNNRDRNIEFKHNDLINIKADKSMIRQVLQNLISNAVKYSKTREKAVIECGCEEREKDIVFYVKDNGVGFDMKYKDKVYGVFQRLHTAEEFEGTGVGLAIVQRIINKHGGSVWAEAKVNKGAAFYFSIPKESA